MSYQQLLQSMISLTLVILLLAGCGTPEPESTPVPPTPTVDPSPDLNSVWATTIETTSTTEQGTVIGRSPEAFIVGDQGTILRYHDSTLEPMESPTTKDLRGIGGNNEHDLFAVGMEGTILHYDGTNWAEMSSGVSHDLRAVAGDGGVGAFAVGVGPTILHFNGEEWESMPTENLKPDVQPFILSSILVFDPNNAFAVGTKGTLLHFDGKQWTDLAQPKEIPGTGLFAGFVNTLEEVTAIWGLSDKDIVAATFFDATSLLIFNGTDWKRISDWGQFGFEVSSRFRSIGGTMNGFSGGPEMVIVGDDGLILHAANDELSKIDTGVKENLNSVSGSGYSIFIVGENNTVIHYFGTGWNKLEISSSTSSSSATAELSPIAPSSLAIEPPLL